MAAQIDPRIGIQGGQKPSQTVSGREAVPPFGRVRQLGQNYYCVLDVWPIVDEKEVVLELKSLVEGYVKAASKSKGSVTNEQPTAPTG